MFLTLPTFAICSWGYRCVCVPLSTRRRRLGVGGLLCLSDSLFLVFCAASNQKMQRVEMDVRISTGQSHAWNLEPRLHPHTLQQTRGTAAFLSSCHTLPLKCLSAG